MTDPAHLLHVAVGAARAAGALLLSRREGERDSVQTKTSSTDMVTEMDRASEELVVGTILAARPGDAFLAEEGTEAEDAAGAAGAAGEAAVRWVIDPLDGTTNYLYGFPSWGVSIAAEVEGEVTVGVVHDPLHDETFTAVRGEGARCNGKLLEVGGPPELSTALVATGFSYDAEARSRQAGVLARILPAVRDVRRTGAASLDLCWVALGRVDLYYEWGLQPWDWAAGSLVAAEAGAVVTLLDDGTKVAAPPRLHEPFLRLLEGAEEG